MAEGLLFFRNSFLGVYFFVYLRFLAIITTAYIEKLSSNESPKIPDPLYSFLKYGLSPGTVTKE